MAKIIDFNSGEVSIATAVAEIRSEKTGKNVDLKSVLCIAAGSNTVKVEDLEVEESEDNELPRLNEYNPDIMLVFSNSKHVEQLMDTLTNIKEELISKGF